jgi:hypothetical protein
LNFYLVRKSSGTGDRALPFELLAVLRRQRPAAGQGPSPRRFWLLIYQVDLHNN